MGGDVARSVLEKALQNLPEGDGIVKIGLLFAELENSFGDLNRARAVYEHTSQFCDPRRYPVFWKIWTEFELRHGNRETYLEMQRIKRSVQAAYATVHFNAQDISNLSP